MLGGGLPAALGLDFIEDVLFLLSDFCFQLDQGVGLQLVVRPAGQRRLLAMDRWVLQHAPRDCLPQFSLGLGGCLCLDFAQSHIKLLLLLDMLAVTR